MLPRLQLCLHRASLAILTDGRFPEDPGHSHTSQFTTQISSTPKRLCLINKSNEDGVTANSQYRVSPKVSVEFLDQSPFLKCRLSPCRFVCMCMVYVYVCVCVHVWGDQRPTSMSVLNLSPSCLSVRVSHWAWCAPVLLDCLGSSGLCLPHVGITGICRHSLPPLCWDYNHWLLLFILVLRIQTQILVQALSQPSHLSRLHGDYLFISI